jgi:formamidopyrimidine-DNA glycosylase
MLEMPEIITIRNQMRDVLVGKQIKEISVISGKKLENTVRQSMVVQTQEEYQERLLNSIITKVENKLNYLLIYTSNDNVLFFGAVYGKILYHKSQDTLPKKKYLHIVFNDSTHLTVTVTFFATLRVFSLQESEEMKSQNNSCLDPSSNEFTLDQFLAKIENWEGVNKISVKKFITSFMPAYIGGIGNGYLQGILYHARLHPKRRMRSLTKDEKVRYFESIKEIVRQGISKGGRSSEVTLFGENGQYSAPVNKDTVGSSCPKCSSIIEKFNHEGGACYVCPGCQPRYL